MNKKIIAIFLVTILIVGGGSFYGGIKYSEGQTSAKFAARGAGNFQPQEMNGSTGSRTGFRTNGNGNMISGEIIAKDEQSIIVKSRDNSSKIIFISESTETLKQASGSIDDLTVGEQVAVTGIADASGNITAKSIQILPATPTSSTEARPL